MATSASPGASGLLQPRATWFSAVTRQERIAAAVLTGALFAYGATVALVSGVSLEALSAVAGMFVTTTACGGMVVALLYFSLRAFLPRLRDDLESRAFWLGVALLITALTFPFFGTFKQLILPARGFVWDPTLAHSTRALLGGTSPWELTHHVFGSVQGTLFLDRLYTGWMIIIFALPMCVAVFTSHKRTKIRILGSWFFAWVLIGTVAAWFLGSAGPCYYNSLVGPDPIYADLQQRLGRLAQQAAAEGYSITTLEFQPLLLQAFDSRVLAPAGGISAMPSMHVALATLCAIAGFQWHRAIGCLATVYAALIWVGSVHFGWHYALDGPVAAIMMLAIWKASGRLVPNNHLTSPRALPELQ